MYLSNAIAAPRYIMPLIMCITLNIQRNYLSICRVNGCSIIAFPHVYMLFKERNVMIWKQQQQQHSARTGTSDGLYYYPLIISEG